MWWWERAGSADSMTKGRPWALAGANGEWRNLLGGESMRCGCASVVVLDDEIAKSG